MYCRIPLTNWLIFSLLSACLFWNSCRSLVTLSPFGVKISGLRLIKYSDSFDVMSDTVVKTWERWADALSMQYLKSNYKYNVKFLKWVSMKQKRSKHNFNLPVIKSSSASLFVTIEVGKVVVEVLCTSTQHTSE